MNEFYIGAYWPNGPLTLRQYADETRQYVLLLASIHPVFRSLEWAGDRPHSAVKLSPDLSNLDDRISRHAGSKRFLYDNANPDGTPSWNSVCHFGYGMDYSTGQSPVDEGLGISPNTAICETRTPRQFLSRHQTPPVSPIASSSTTSF